MAPEKKGRKPKTTKEDHWGKRLKSCLHEHGLSIRAAAKIAGVAPSVLSSWIAHGVSPSDLKVVKKLCDALDVSFTWILTGEPDKKTKRANVAEYFKEMEIFNGLARIAIHRLVPRDEESNGEDT